MWQRRCCNLFYRLTFRCKQDGKRCRKATVDLLILFLITFLLVLPALLFRHRYSLYYIRPRSNSQETEFLKAQGTGRYVKAVESIENYKKLLDWNRETSFSVLNKPLDVGITIITVSRNRHKFSDYEPRYLTQVVGAYLDLLRSKQAQLKHYQLFLCNVDSDPTTYLEFQNLSSMFPNFQRFKSKITVSDVFPKEKDDYVYCLNQTLEAGAKHVLLVEDDALPMADLILMVNHVIDFHFQTTRLDDTSGGSRARKEPAAYVKFYHPDRLLGYWSPELDRIPQLLSSGLLFGTILFLIYQNFTKIDLRPSNTLWVWLLFMTYIILGCVVIGRQNLIEWRRISRYFYLYTPTASCCTPAILYPETAGKEVVKYLAKQKCTWRYAKDAALDNFRNQTGAKAFMLQPNLFTHIGLFSSLRDTVLNPFIV